MAATADDLPTYADCVVSINGDRNNITTSNKKKDRPDNFYGRYQKKLPSSADNDGVCGKCCRTAPITLDILLLMFVLTPCSVIFWVVTWEMANRFKYRLYELSVILSAILFVFFHVAQPVIYKTVRRLYGGKRMFWFYIISRAYLYVFSTSGVIFWTFCWEEGVEKIPGINGHPYVTAFSSLAGFAVLRCMKCLPNISGGIGGASEEKTAEDVFLFPNLCNVQWKKNKFLYLLDSVFSVMIVGILVILVWRGTWCLLDTYIYPDDSVRSGLISLVLGYGIVFITFLLQPVMKVLIKKYHHWRRLVIIDIYVVISFCGTINIWRGMWAVYDEYCDLDNLLNSCLVHFASFFILVLFNSSNTLLVRGVYIDAEENAEECIEFPCYYFRLMFQERQKKNALKNLNLEHQKDTLLQNNAATNATAAIAMKMKESSDTTETSPSTNGNVKANSDPKTFEVENKLMINNRNIGQFQYRLENGAGN